jgi:predicted NAD/FAD-binding protein
VKDNQSREQPASGKDDPTKRLISKSFYSKQQVCVHNDMNRLQSIPWPGQPGSPGRVIVTLNPLRQPDSIQCQRTYHLPIICSAGVKAARKLHLLNEADNVSFAGAWMGFAFHEDGFSAGLAVAKKILTGTYENPTRFRSGEDLKESVSRPSLKVRLLRLAIATVQFGISSMECLVSKKKLD